MLNVEVSIVKAFTKDPTQGNPAGVVLSADNLTDRQMLHISAQLGFSESAFVQKSDKADFRVRFFSPTQEVDLCGHATIATFHTLLKEGSIHQGIYTQEIKAGVLDIECSGEGRIMMKQNAPVFLGDQTRDKGKIAMFLGIHEHGIMDSPLEIVSTGTPKLIIPIISRETLFHITPDFEGIKAYCRKSGARGFYPFTAETINKEADFHARQFNPLAGIDEDPITGVAAGALGAYVKKYGLLNKTVLLVEQGFIMNKGGIMTVDISNGVKVGGYAVIVEKKVIES